MKRDQRLYPLSWTHHDLLVYADRVRMALTTDHPAFRQSLEKLVEQTFLFWNDVFQEHMRAEKEILFVCLEYFPDQFKDELKILRIEFEELVELFKAISSQSRPEEIKPKLIRFADLLIHHVRYEERELFPKVQKTLPEAEFNWVGHELNEKLPRRCRTHPIRPAGFP